MLITAKSRQSEDGIIVIKPRPPNLNDQVESSKFSSYNTIADADGAHTHTHCITHQQTIALHEFPNVFKYMTVEPCRI